MIGNAHLDPSWVWTWQEGSCEAKATIRSALDRMKEFPDFQFTCSSASVFQWIEEFAPEMFEEIRKAVSSGRFVIVGGWNVQPDCNLPSGENFARQSLYSQRYFLEKFGKTATVGYNVDSFGHNAMMPQILKKSGMDSYVFMRPMEHEKHLDENVFVWEAPDGSRVDAFRLQICYNHYCENVDALQNDLQENAKAFDDREFMFFYGVGNHGGGPTVLNIRSILDYNAGENRGFEPIMSTPETFFKYYKSKYEMPVYGGELQMHASGCYSAVSAVKRVLRKGECALVEAESFSALAKGVIGKDYDAEKIKAGWENLNFLAFHDILGGCCVKVAYNESLYMGEEALSIAAKAKNGALQTLSWKVDTRDTAFGLPIVVFNPHAFDAEETIEINQCALAVRDAQGNAVPFVNVVSHAQSVWGRKNTVFRAKVPALGYATYYYEQGKMDTEESAADASTMENEFIKASFDAYGRLVSVFDKVRGFETLDGGERACVFDESEHDTWSHGKNEFTEFIGEFTLQKAERLEANRLREIVKTTAVYGDSKLERYYILNVGEDFLRVRVRLLWLEKHKMLKIALPVACERARSFSEIPFGAIERDCVGEENCCLKWTAVCDEKGGLAVLNDGKYAYSAKENTLYLTAIRSPIYCDHGNVRSAESEYTDQGIHEFVYGYMPIAPNERVRIFRRAALLNTGLTSVLENHHKGTLPLCARGMEIGSENVLVSALKKSEDGRGYALRAYECDGKLTPTEIKIAWLPPLKTTFSPYEIKTFVCVDGTWQETLFTELLQE